MLSRAEQIDVLRYWEEIELLTPPDYRVVENERLLVCEWKSGRPAGREAQAIAKWQKERWQEPFEYPERAPRGVVTDMMPVFILKTVESTLSQIRRRRARGTSGLWPSSP